MDKLDQFKMPVEYEPQTKQLSQAELFTSIKDRLIKTLADHKIECVNDGKYLRLKKDDKQVGIMFKMPDGNRTTIRFDSGLQAIIDDFESSLPSELIFCVDRDSNSTDFTFFPNLTEKEVEALRLEIEPIDGHTVIIQGEYIVASKQDKTTLISTYGLSSCRGMIIYDPKNGMAAAAHSDANYADLSLIQQMRNDLINKGANPANLKFFGTPNIDSQKKQYFIDKMFLETTYEIPSDFTFDCKNGQITTFDIKSLPQSANLDQRIGGGVDTRIKHHIPYIRKKIK